MCNSIIWVAHEENTVHHLKYIKENIGVIQKLHIQYDLVKCKLIISLQNFSILSFNWIVCLPGVESCEFLSAHQ